MAATHDHQTVRLNETVGFEWADTCSKPRLDAFGGGAMFVTATEIRGMHTSRWLAEQESKGQEQQA